MKNQNEVCIGPNVEQIRCRAMRVVNGRIPSTVRRELMGAVKSGLLGRLPKDGLKPEIFYHPDHKHGAIDRQKREAEYSRSLIAGVVVSGTEKAAYVFDQITNANEGVK